MGARSTLITSAPISANMRPHVGPAITWASSITLTPASGPVAISEGILYPYLSEFMKNQTLDLLILCEDLHAARAKTFLQYRGSTNL